MVVLSMLLAGTIAGPVRRLADAAEHVRRRIKSRVEIPDFTRRRDEIGDLSGTLRAMTDALYSRIEGIESFAADVAHELKNPLTSLRSAVETLPLAKTEESRDRLLGVIEHDVRRLDRLISDISDASRLDAELQRQDTTPVDFTRLLTTVVSVANEVKHDDNVKVTLAFSGGPFVVPGHDSRLGQVINNLIDNARSFSPAGGTVRVTCRRLRDEVEITVDDDGPGIRPDALEKIFERFYTDRPQQGFGQNSGLGLSISKQIVEAHGGRLWAENRLRGPTPTQPCSARASRAAARDAMTVAASIHASAVLVGARAVLIRGRSGSGKSRLALELLQSGGGGHLPFARLVSDDRTLVEAGAWPPAGAAGAEPRRACSRSAGSASSMSLTSRSPWSSSWSISPLRRRGCRRPGRSGHDHRGYYPAAAGDRRLAWIRGRLFSPPSPPAHTANRRESHSQVAVRRLAEK